MQFNKRLYYPRGKGILANNILPTFMSLWVYPLIRNTIPWDNSEHFICWSIKPWLQYLLKFDNWTFPDNNYDHSSMYKRSTLGPWIWCLRFTKVNTYLVTCFLPLETLPKYHILQNFIIVDPKTNHILLFSWCLIIIFCEEYLDEIDQSHQYYANFGLKCF